MPQEPCDGSERPLALQRPRWWILPGERCADSHHIGTDGALMEFPSRKVGRLRASILSTVMPLVRSAPGTLP
jgi:hypothetical protein